MSSTGFGPAGTPPSDQTAALSPPGVGRGQRLGDLRRGPERKRLAVALLLSLAIHALLLSLTFGGQGLGLPGFGFPWQDRRVEVPGLRVMIVPARVSGARPPAKSAAAPLPPQAAIEPPAAGGSVRRSSVSPAPPPRRTADAIAPEARPKAEVAPEANDVAVVAADAKVPPSAARPVDAAPAPIPEPAVIASERPDESTWVVRPAPSVPMPVIAAAPSASSPEPVLEAPRDAHDEERERIDPEDRERAADAAGSDRSEREAQRQAEELEAARVEAARLEAEREEAALHEAVRQEAARIDAARLEAERQEAELLAAASQEAARQEFARQEAARVEAARLEAERLEAARQAAAWQEAVRQESARQEAARVEAARLEAERQETARQAAARQEAERQESARQEAVRAEAARSDAERQEAVRQALARQQAAQEQDARREAARRAMGRQLDEEAARRDAASSAPRPQATLPYSWSSARRGRLFGRTDPNTELIEYAEAWARKLELNMTFDMVREAAKRPHVNPLVTVAIRHDGSVESVTFVVSSGVAEIDEAIRLIVQSQAPYHAFPPGLARDFDVIEIRRTWYFDMAVRLY